MILKGNAQKSPDPSVQAESIYGFIKRRPLKNFSKLFLNKYDNLKSNLHE